MFFGAMFLPPAVMMISFLRPVIAEEAVLVELAEIAGVEPAVDEGLGGGLGLLVVAEEHVGAPDQDLAVVGDLHLDAGEGRADDAELVLPGTG